MATFTGVGFPDSVGVRSPSLPDALTTPEFNGSASSEPITQPAIGPWSQTWPKTAMAQHGLAGLALKNFGNSVFFNRMMMEPRSIDAGNISDVSSYRVVVFNSHESPVTLSNIYEDGSSGIEVTGPSTPIVIQPFEEYWFYVNILADGPSDINSNVIFDFVDNSNDYTLPVVGSRIVSFPFFFRSEATERLQWNTEVITSRDGTEQRIKNRLTPRQSFTSSVFIHHLNTTLADDFFLANAARVWAVPVWSESRIGSPITAGDEVINVDTRFADFRVGGSVVFWSNPRKFDTAAIVSMTDSSITISRGIKYSMPKPSVAPVRSCRLAGKPTRSIGAANGAASVSFDVIDNIDLSSGPMEYQHNGLDVLVESPYLDSNVTYDNPLNIIDNGIGVPEILPSWKRTKATKSFKIPMDSQEYAWRFRGILHRIAGRSRGFYMPSFERNLRIKTPVNIVNGFDIYDDGQFGAESYRKEIAFKMLDGTWQFGTILTIVRLDESTLTVNLVNTLNIISDEVEMVCYMGKKRLGSDNVNISWGGNYSGEANISIVEYDL